MSAQAPIVSHGRGGAANIGPDSTPYTDGEIVREGPTGDQGDGAYSAGRGGAGNIGSPGQKPTTKHAHDEEVVPEIAMLDKPSQEYHVGRGGAGNVHHETQKPMVQEGLADKLKHKILGRKSKE